MPSCHVDLSCDECGVFPVYGTRYTSKTHVGYNICRNCLDENHNGSAHHFVAFEDYVNDNDAYKAAGFDENAVAERSFYFHSMKDLVDCEALHDPNSQIDAICISMNENIETLQERETVRRLLENHTALPKVDVQLWDGDLTDNILAIVSGLQNNRSVRSVSWNFNEGFVIPDLVHQTLKELVTNTTTIRYMFFYDDTLNARLENYLFDGLQGTWLHTFYYNTPEQVKDHNKKKAWKAMKENPHLKRIKTTFENEDYMLDLLTRDKKEQWTNQWLQSNDQECWKVLQEALGACDDIDRVFVINHFLESRPLLALQYWWA
jgi:Zinc finger, ZZ type